MSTILVTGACGGVGSWTVEHLAREGHDVVGVDLRTPQGTRENVDFKAADLTDYGETKQLIEAADPDAVCHLAAIPDPEDHAGSRVFENNTVSTYNVLDAAGAADARIVQASSESAYGMVFSADDWLPEALPVDEGTPMRPEDPYALSKVVGEEIAKGVARRYGVEVVSIRPSWVNYPGEYQTRAAREGFDPETAELSGNLWSYIDVRDLVSALTAAIEVDVDGHEAALIVAAENFLDRDTAATIEAVHGELPAACDLSGDESAFDCSKAARLLGWEAEHSWREAEDESVAGPAFV